MQVPSLAKARSAVDLPWDINSCPNFVPLTQGMWTKKIEKLCHPIALTRVTVDFEIQAEQQRVVCTASAETVGPTGVEMEALTAVQVALLTIYDMCKAADRGMVIGDVKLLEKHGGKSGRWVA